MPNLDLKYVKDENGNKVLPITHQKAVRDDNGISLDTILGSIDDAKADKATTLAGYGITDAYTKTEVNGLVDTPHQNYVTVATYASLPASGSADTIYRVSNYNGSTSQVDVTSYSEYAWNGSSYTFLCVKSQIGEVFDISVYNNNAKYADLSAALGASGANVPQELRKGGMSVKFVQSSDNKYVQFRCMAQNFTTDVAQWQGVDSTPVKFSKNLIESGAVKTIDEKVSGLTSEELYINSLGNWNYSSSSTYKIYPVPVNQGDIITVKWKGTANADKGHRVVVTSYPVTGQPVNNLLAEDVAETLDETITIPSDGYFVYWDTFNNRDIAPQSMLLNGKDVLIMTNGLQASVQENKEDIEELHGDLEDTKEDVDSATADIVTLKESVGNVKTQVEPIQLTWVAGGIKTTNIGSAVILSTSSAYNHTIAPCEPSKKYKIHIEKINSSANYGYNVYFTDSNDIVISRYAPNTSLSYDGTLTAPAGASKIYINIVLGVGQTVSCAELVAYPLQDQIDDIVSQNKMMADHGMFDLESRWWILEKYLEDTYASNENIALSAFISKFTARAGEGKYQIGVISDTHGSGAYSWRTISDTDYATCLRSIAVFNKIAAYCDAIAHGGDISCDYGTSRLRELQYMQEIIRLFRVNKPFFITKGNHDENNNKYIEADMLNLDWAHNSYFIRNHAEFTQVTEATWDGSPLYIEQNELVSDREFKTFAQKWACPSAAVWGNGGYYYYDIESVKIRFIVCNSFPVKDDYTNGDSEEYLWLAQIALNLSAKTTPSNWKVIMLRHTQSTGLTDLSNCINAFRNGSTWTYGETTVDFGSVNGGGITFIAHIHGHEHSNVFSNGAGYFDIGENAAFVGNTHVGDAAYYGISVWTIDTINSKVYEDTINGNTWCYNYSTNKLELGVGETVKVARSGIPSGASVTVTSSDTSVATTNGQIVTAVSAGNATISLSDGTTTWQYPIVVV